MEEVITNAVEKGIVFFVEKPLYLHEKKKAILLIVQDPSSFAVRFINEEDLECQSQLNKALERFAESSDSKYQPKAICNGMPVMVPNPMEPGMYCRGQLTATDGNSLTSPQVAVNLIDLGYTVIVNSDSLRMVTMELLRVPKLAYFCKLYKVESCGEVWPDIDWVPHFSGEEIVLSIKNQNDSNLYEVQMSVDTVDVADRLVNELMLAKMTPLEKIRSSGPYPLYDFNNWTNLRIPVYGVSVISAGNAWFQLNPDDANFLMDATEAYIQSLTEELRHETFEMVVGVPCLALYKDDGLWYRAVILEVKELNTFKVMFVDFGNVELVNNTDLIRLPQHLLNIPVGATEVIIKDVLEINTKEDVEKLKTLIESKDLIAEIDNARLQTGGGKYSVVISLWLEDGTSLSEYFPGKGKETVYPSISTPEFSSQDFSLLMTGGLSDYFPGREYSGVISFIESVTSVWLQLEDGDVQAEMLSEEVNRYYSHSELMIDDNCLQKGFYCAAKQVDDARWYRALISDINPADNTVTVVFIDYGNDEVIPVENVKPLITYFARHKAFSFQAALEAEEKPGVNPEDSVNAILDFTQDKRLSVALNHKNDFNYASIKLDLVDVLCERNLVNKLTLK